MKIIRALLYLPMDIWQAFISQLPGPFGYFLRYCYWRKRLKFLGKKVQIDVGVYFQNPGFITLDDYCWIDRGVMILAGPDKSNRLRRFRVNDRFPLARGEVYIGKNVHIGPYGVISGISGVYIGDDGAYSAGFKAFSFSHHYRSDEDPSNKTYRFGTGPDPEREFMLEGPIFIEKNVGAGVNVVILPGVSILKDSFVAINSVVSSSFGENSLIAGNPAKLVKERFISTPEK